jgi:protoporphyrinogen oxidase
MIVILGAGLAGLSAAHHLRRAGREDLVVVDREDRPGGLCRSESIDGYTFDYTGHYLHFRRPAIRDWVMSLCGERLHSVARRAWIHSHGVYTPYPFQANTHGLPTDVVKECVLGFVEASMSAAAAGSGGVQSTTDDPDRNFEDWILETLGPGIAKHFMVPYNTKLWTIPPREMTTEWMGRFVPRPSIEEVIDGALVDRRDKLFGYNAHFLYPIEGGIQVLPVAIAAGAGPIRLGTEVTGIDLGKRRVEIRDGEPIEYESLITTLPLDALVRTLKPLPAAVTAAGGRLRHNSVLSVNIGVEGRTLSDRNWVYFPEPEFCFYRLGFPSNSSPKVAPPGASSVTAEVSFSDARPIDRGATIKQVKTDLERLNILRRGDRIGVEATFEIPCAYVLYDRDRRRSVSEIQTYLQSQSIYSVGRYGSWEYSSMEDAITAGKEAADLIVRAEAA